MGRRYIAIGWRNIRNGEREWKGGGGRMEEGAGRWGGARKEGPLNKGASVASNYTRIMNNFVS